MSLSLPAEIESRRSGIADLCRRYGVRTLYLFGSAATAAWDSSRSDFDFIVSFLPRPRESIADRYLGLANGLEAILGRPVDLLTENAVRNPYFRRNVDATRVALYAA